MELKTCPKCHGTGDVYIDISIKDEMPTYELEYCTLCLGFGFIKANDIVSKKPNEKLKNLVKEMLENEKQEVEKWKNMKLSEREKKIKQMKLLYQKEKQQTFD